MLKKKTKGYSQWLEQRELRSEKIKISKSDSEKKKEIEEEGWKTNLKKWVKEASEEEFNAELKSELKKALESYNEFEYLTRKFLELYKKSQHEKLTEIEKNRLKTLRERLQGLGPIQLELLANIRAFKDYYYNHLWELMNRFFEIRVRSKFVKHISQKILKLKELINSNEKLNIKEVQSSMPQESHISNIKFPNFEKNVMKHIKNLTGLIEYTEEQKKIILLKSEKILNEHISRAERGEINISPQTRPLSNAAAIIYTVILSHEKMKKISGLKMGKIIGVSKDVIPRLYRDLYKGIARKLEFDFKGAQLGRSRKILSLYFFKLLNNAELDLPNLILHLEKIFISKIILRLKEIFVGEEKRLTQKEKQLLEQLTEREIKHYKEMGRNYLETFVKYLTDLCNIIKLLIISIKTHNIVGADFFCLPFVRFLMNEKDINLFLKEDVLHREIGDIYDYVKGAGYSNLFPARRKKVSSGKTYWSQSTKSEHNYRVGSRIKIYIMKHIYKGKYFKNGLSVCLDCFMGRKQHNISFPRLRAKSFHHEDEDLRKDEYRSERLSKLFNINRGNPYFLSDLINQMELESVILKCRCHHQLFHSYSFYDFKKLISWEDVYCKEFPYKDIFDLSAEIIHILATVCVDNFYKTKTKTATEKKRWIDDIIISLKKRYFIDLLYGGVCPICGEFNSKDHLPVFDFNHLYKKNELTPEERKERKKINDLFFLPCSVIVKEMKKKYNKGAFVCCNDHMVIHETISNKIYDEQELSNANFKDHNDTIEKFKQNLIHHMKNKNLIKDVLKLKGSKRIPLKKFLMAIFKISEEKGVVSTGDLMNKTKLSKSAVGYLFNVKREFLDKYGELVIGRGHTPTKYYINDDGRRIMRLIYFFRDFFKNLEPEKDAIKVFP